MDDFLVAQENFEVTRESVLDSLERPSEDVTIKLLDLRKTLTHAADEYLEKGVCLLKLELSSNLENTHTLAKRVRELEMELEDLQIINFNEAGVEGILNEIEEEKEKLTLLQSTKSELDTDIQRLRNELPRTEELQKRVENALNSLSAEKQKIFQMDQETDLLNNSLQEKQKRKQEYDSLVDRLRMMDTETQKLADEIYLKTDHNLDHLREVEKKLQDQLEELDEFELDELDSN